MSRVCGVVVSSKTASCSDVSISWSSGQYARTSLQTSNFIPGEPLMNSVFKVGANFGFCCLNSSTRLWLNQGVGCSLPNSLPPPPKKPSCRKPASASPIEFRKMFSSSEYVLFVRAIMPENLQEFWCTIQLWSSGKPSTCLTVICLVQCTEDYHGKFPDILTNLPLFSVIQHNY